MAITHSNMDITWSASHSVSVTSGSNQTSDSFTMDDTCIRAQLQCKANNAGTPAAGDTIEIWYQQTLGDPDAAEVGTDEWDTNAHSVLLCVLDTNAENPAIETVPLPLPNKSFRIRAVSNASSNSITVSATGIEQRAA